MKIDKGFYKDFWKLSPSARNKKQITESEIRKDYLQERFAVIAPTRKWKIKEAGGAGAEAGASCQFCPENVKKEKSIEEVRQGGKWQVKVVGNKFPTFSSLNPKARGVQEIIIETPEHGKHLSDFSLPEIEAAIGTYANRAAVLGKETSVNYILTFKNSGREAGASVDHEHSQIFATEIIPDFILDKARKEEAYKRENGSCVYCDIIKAEAKGPRLIYQDDDFIVYAPYASFLAYEVVAMPLRHSGKITELNAGEKASLAKIFQAISAGIKELGLPYNFYFHNLPKSRDRHLYFKFQPRSNVWAGFELGTELIINPMPPEDAAGHYKKFFSSSPSLGEGG